MPASDIKLNDRFLAIVLLDIIGSTSFVQKNGAHNAAKWFQFHDRLTRSICYKHSGREIDRSDGFLLSFDRLIDAVNFALKYQNDVPRQTKLQCRIGIHWGKVVEITQHDVFVEAGAKRVELEGLAKNIAARTMSLCGAGQILLTKEAKMQLEKRSNSSLPPDVRVACVGLYRFKGVRHPQEIYAIGASVEMLQPPMGSDKVKRLGGPSYIKKRYRDRKINEQIMFVFWRAGILNFLFVLYYLSPMLIDPSRRWGLGLPRQIEWLDAVLSWFRTSLDFLK